MRVRRPPPDTAVDMSTPTHRVRAANLRATRALPCPAPVALGAAFGGCHIAPAVEPRGSTSMLPPHSASLARVSLARQVSAAALAGGRSLARAPRARAHTHVLSMEPCDELTLASLSAMAALSKLAMAEHTAGCAALRTCCLCSGAARVYVCRRRRSPRPAGEHSMRIKKKIQTYSFLHSTQGTHGTTPALPWEAALNAALGARPHSTSGSGSGSGIRARLQAKDPSLAGCFGLLLLVRWRRPRAAGCRSPRRRGQQQRH